MSTWICRRTGARGLAVTGLIGFMLALGACALPQAREGEARVFALNAQVSTSTSASASRQLLVDAPSAAGLLDSERIVVRAGPDELGVLRGARWSAPLPQLWQGLLIRAVEDDGRLRVGRERDVLSGDERLIGELRAFEHQRDASQVHIHFHAKRVDRRQRIVAERSFQTSAPVRGGDAADVVAAFNAANEALLGELLDWLVAAQP